LEVDHVGGILANDSDVDLDDLISLLNTPPVHGTLLLSDDGSFAYTPNDGYFGEDSFSYTAYDGVAASTAVLVHLTVKAPPVAAGDLFALTEDTPLNVTGIGVLGNDHDDDSPQLFARVVQPPTHGSLQLNSDGSFTRSTPN
jgi:hypothetical protein